MNVKTQSQQVNYALITEVENLNSTAAKKVSYSFLNPQERLVLWQRHLEAFLSADLSAAQKAHIEVLEKYLTAETFSSGVDLLKVGEFLGPWEETANRLFGRPLLHYIVSDIHNRQFSIDLVSAFNAGTSKSVAENATPDGGGTGTIGDNPTCSCATSSDYCEQHMKCTKSSPASPCDNTSGCGTLLLYTCNGLCLIAND